ncbi:hypothetical protein CR194_02915 [Salipaludibacillus keqinensis]|uniref:ABC transporter periplasmic binding protein yphF n=1 Tax=Salipaludibacillus keqinensis TaxID=2045207 RepID=A0A323TI95_9BACI|nr:hypothetical protein [Salipaludibacillus keqinensis]PYZ94499.1 hypothetical protein CR194_02915 [Salipaludibacillus keqinensis]
MIKIRIISLVISIGILTGCMYPEEERRQNQAPYEDQLQSVQQAVTQFRENTSVLPIKTREAETAIFRKYPVDFSQLVPAYLQSPPGNSFENGGIYQYVLVNPEETAEVKLIDLRSVRVIQDLERRLYQYRSQHQYAPIEEVIGDELLKLDFDQLDYEEQPTVESPFHPSHRLPILFGTDGSIIIDYSLDIQHYVDEHGMENYEEGDDLRWLLVEESPFLPVNSLPQTIEDGEVKFINE